jgi:hypothetical protein
MNRRVLLQAISATAILQTAGAMSAKAETKVTKDTVYELRVYHCYDGKLDDLLARFRNHTTRIFEKHGMRNVAYWTPLDEPLKGRTLFYVLAHTSREAAEANWKQFREDPEWIQVQKASEANGKLVEKADSTFLSLTDFSPVI